ncbi:MAG: HEAT repeat domain-containing protein [Bacillota bacterium]
MAYDLDRILTGMNDPDEATRLSAAYGLEQALKEELEAGRTDWEPLAGRILPVLIEGIGDQHKGVQVHSANCLQFLAYQSEAVIPALREAMRGAGSWRAWGAAIVFARLGLWSPEVGPALAGAMGARDRDVRWAAAGYALQLGRKYPEAVEMVMQTLASPEPLARKMAAYCLGAMGEYADVEAVLAGRLTDPERDVRRSVILAIAKLPQVSEPVLQQIAALRHDPDLYVQRTADAVARKYGL